MWVNFFKKTIFFFIYVGLWTPSFIVAMEEEFIESSARPLPMPTGRPMGGCNPIFPTYEAENIFFKKLASFIETSQNVENVSTLSNIVFDLRRTFESQKAQSRILSFDGGGVRGALSLQLWLLIQQEIIRRLETGQETDDLRNVFAKRNEIQAQEAGPANSQNLLFIHGVYEEDSRKYFQPLHSSKGCLQGLLQGP